MGFTSTLKTEWIEVGGKLRWRALETFEFHSGAKDEGLFARCQEGMISDLASIPLAVRWLIPKAGKDAQGAFVHDRGYRDGFLWIRVNEMERRVRVSRAIVDSLYYQAMVALKVHPFRREAIYRGLQVGGWVVWRNYRRKSGMCSETTR